MNFKALNVWKKSRILNLKIYKVTQNFPKEELFSLTNQVRRCSISISSNIAEGNGRDSTKEYLYFLNIAKGSCTELECQIILAQDIGYIDEDTSVSLQEQIIEIIKMLSGLVSKLKSKI